MALSIKPYIENKERIHLIGIGGVSMNSLGELLLSKGVPVSGSDRLRTDVTARLEALGAKITYEHKPENVEGAALIVRTAAVHDENPEIVRAHELGIPVMERAEAWGHIMRDYDNVAPCRPAPSRYTGCTGCCRWCSRGAADRRRPTGADSRRYSRGARLP